MATRETDQGGTGTGAPGPAVPHAVALAVLAEEPSTGLFPGRATPAAPAPERARGSAAPAVPAPGVRTESGPEPAAGAPPRPATSTGAPATSTTAPAPAGAVPGAAPAAPGTGTTAEATATAATGTSARAAAAAGPAAPSVPPTPGRVSALRRTVGMPPGRPGRPMIAAAVAGGLVLIGVPFLVSGPDETPKPVRAEGLAGSPMGPDGSGRGFVPDRQDVPGSFLLKEDPREGAAEGEGRGPYAATEALHEDGGPGTSAGNLTEPGRTPNGAVPNGTTPDGAVPDSTTGPGPGPGSGTGPGKGPGPGPGPGTGPGSVAGPETAKETPAPQPVKPSGPAAATYRHLIGPGCDTPGFATARYREDGKKAWHGSKNSLKDYGCSGFYYSMPLSGNASKSDGTYAQWKFKTGAVTKGTCAVSVFIPNVRDIEYVGGTPASYTVYKYFDPKASNQVGTFEINQTAHLGNWVSAGRFPVSDGKLSVVMDNRGKNSGNRHAAASAIKVDCTR